MRERDCIEYGEHVINFEIVRRDRTTMEIAVEPDTSIVVAVPMAATIDAIKAKLRKRAAWVMQQQRYFAQFMPRTPERRYVAGETHRYLGRQYRLKILLHVQQAVKLTRGHIVVQTHRPSQSDITRELVEGWYRERAHLKFAERLEVNLHRFADPEAYRPKGLIIRHLRQRWGSMSPACRLMLNRRLVEAPIDAIDYVITHELCHIRHPNHGAKFFELLGLILPDWQRRKDRLERSMT